MGVLDTAYAQCIYNKQSIYIAHRSSLILTGKIHTVLINKTLLINT